MTLDKLTSAIINDVQSGLAGMNANPTLPYEQISDECLEVREAVIKEFWYKNLLRPKELAQAINCVPVDCDDMNKCPCANLPAKNQKHFEIPKLISTIGNDAIIYIGSTDRSTPFKVYYNRNSAQAHLYGRKKNMPYVYLERTPNANGMYDGWIFNAPFVSNIAVIGLFKDPRQLAEFNCCGEPDDYEDFGSISNEVKNRIVKNKVQLYRQYLMPPHQTDLSPR